MKKALMLIFIALVAIGSVWGQIPSEDKKFAGLGDSVFDLFDFYNAVPTLSTEARYSAWQFDSDIDNYIDPIFYTPDIGTFFYLGGYPAGNNVNDTNRLTPGGGVPNQGSSIEPPVFFTNGNYAISFGFGKTINDNIYLAAYYGGSFMEAFGQTTKYETDPQKYDTYAFSIWQNNLAVLLGMRDMGFRFDLIMNESANDKKTTEDKKDVTANLQNGTSLALTWGTSFGQLAPYTTLGFKFADSETLNLNGNKASYSGGAALSFVTGAYYDLTEVSYVNAALVVGTQFAESYQGNESVLQSVYSLPAHSSGGMFGVGLNMGYSHKWGTEKVSFKIKPNLDLGLVSVSNKNSLNSVPDLPSNNYFTLSMGLDTGLKYEPSKKFAFYTGVGFRLFEWNTHNQRGGDNDNQTKESEWEITGISWNEASLASGNLGFGLVFNPSEYVSFGCGLNSFLNNIVEFNLKEMTVKAGRIWGENKGNFGSWGSGLLNNVTLDLTISIKIPTDGITSKDSE